MNAEQRRRRKLLNAIRDVVIRRRSGLPTTEDVDELLEQAAETIETLDRELELARPW